MNLSNPLRDAQIQGTSLSRSASAVTVKTKPRRIGFFGIFGVRNLGNECTLEAILHNARRYAPAAELYAISYEPEDTARRHGIRAFPARPLGGTSFGKKRTVINRLLRVLTQKIPAEVFSWFTAIRILKGTEMLIMTGTGMLTDYSNSCFGWPYHILKWAVCARIVGCRVRFISSGVGPIHERLSRRFIKIALGLADYRSFRDKQSKMKLQGLGMELSSDPVVPDLAFSLPTDMVHAASPRPKVRTVGLGVMRHVNLHLGSATGTRDAYRSYLRKMCDLMEWLIRHGYGVRMLQGDAKYDESVRRDIRLAFESRGMNYEKVGILDEDSASPAEVLEQISRTDFVISPRFHNLVFAFILGRPAISISYDPKNDALLESMDLGKYRQSITDLSTEVLIGQFEELSARTAEVSPALLNKAAEFRNILEKQYELIFNA
ncbi:MAG: polysaccharide pyruvyl transferase family protein [Terriglobales bacterium]